MLRDTNRMRTLTDEELLRIAYIERDDLTSTALEIELLRRLDFYSGKHDLLEAIEDIGLTAGDLEPLTELPVGFETTANLMRVLELFELYDPARLREVIYCVEKLQALAANKTDDFLTDLTNLLTKAQEIDL